MAENENAGEQKPKIIVDDDWKAQAKAEKERLAREVDHKQAEGEAAGAQADEAAGAAAGESAGAPTRQAAAQAKAGQQQQRQIPPASFETHVNSLVTQAFMAMGGMEDPRTKKRYMDLDLAKYHIDTLAMLEEKTKGNLTDEEKQMIDQGLYECRMQYVHMAQSVADMAAPGAEFER